MNPKARFAHSAHVKTAMKNYRNSATLQRIAPTTMHYRTNALRQHRIGDITHYGNSLERQCRINASPEHRIKAFRYFRNDELQHSRMYIILYVDFC